MEIIKIVDSQRNICFLKFRNIEKREFISKKVCGSLLEVMAQRHNALCGLGHKCPRMLGFNLN
jgi:hypothetical protein